MYYRRALELQAFLDMAKDDGIISYKVNSVTANYRECKQLYFLICTDLMEGYKAIETSEDQIKGERSLWTQCQAVADMKFTYVVSCQLYGIQKRSGDQRAQDILRLMTTYGFIELWRLYPTSALSNLLFLWTDIHLFE